ncbi:ATP-dependent helicase [Dictyobacter arantiisoli]|uniref:DNA 3'-5' helicase n=1 Tax=Dictyobacter arantiisoli TaxID=2014874 RepID=A0A5A5TJT0_9CHLR|nr:ATP-dependent DNA helicase [Dictyobacter arantiisoli]GCF11283.1 DNA helicase II [Dictyobacter arantiisoli]
MVHPIDFIAPELYPRYEMNEAQVEIISHKKGPLRIIAGPGSGKTYSLTLLAMNLLLCGDTPPEGIVLCTYTEKAAHEMQDRLFQIAHEINYSGDLSAIKIGTIHGICKQFINRYLHHTPLGNNYETLDQFGQRLLIYQCLTGLKPLDSPFCSPPMLAYFHKLDGWGSDWNIAKNLQFLFDKITEELIIDRLREAFPVPRIEKASDQITVASFLTYLYTRYELLLRDANYVDFAHLQKYAYDLLRLPEVFALITKDIRYVLVDEYQDTNYIQEQLLASLAAATPQNNFCVVGDEDQSLYRFRGATVRNILEFHQTFPECRQIELTINYRSNSQIIDTCNQWMRSLDDSLSRANAGQATIFRTSKTIRPDPSVPAVIHPAVVTLSEFDPEREAEQLAILVSDLKAVNKIQDYSQVALLLQSVRPDYSEPYIRAFQARGIPASCLRARDYFAQMEVQLLIGCFTQLLHFYDGAALPEQENFIDYVRACKAMAIKYSQQYGDLRSELAAIQQELWTEDEDRTAPEQQLADYFYRLLATEAFKSFRVQKQPLANLVLFSQHLKTFFSSFQHLTVTSKNLSALQHDFFYIFLYLLHQEGVNQMADPDELVPEDHVQIITIHQSKGLEFPVVIVGRMDRKPFSVDALDKPIKPFYRREPFEPDKYIPAFDLRRLFYVAFSRAQQLLILSASKRPQTQFMGLFQENPASAYNYQAILDMPAAGPHKRHDPPKRRFSLTGHIITYTTCPKRFEYFREYGFMPARTANTFYGQLIHQTLEAIHRVTLERSLAVLEDAEIEDLFKRTFYFLTCTSMTPPDRANLQKARTQVLRYVDQNLMELQSIYDAEYDFQVEKKDYILTGKMDLLLQGKQGLEIVDFKTGARPANNSARLENYKQQLLLYAHALERRTGQLPQKLYLYWTDEKEKDDARLEVPYHEEDIERVSSYFDMISQRILSKQFEVVTPPDPTVCKGCDMRHLCLKNGTIHIS